MQQRSTTLYHIALICAALAGLNIGLGIAHPNPLSFLNIFGGLFAVRIGRQMLQRSFSAEEWEQNYKP